MLNWARETSNSLTSSGSLSAKARSRALVPAPTRTGSRGGTPLLRPAADSGGRALFAVAARAEPASHSGASGHPAGIVFPGRRRSSNLAPSRGTRAAGVVARDQLRDCRRAPEHPHATLSYATAQPTLEGPTRRIRPPPRDPRRRGRSRRPARGRSCALQSGRSSVRPKERTAALTAPVHGTPAV